MSDTQRDREERQHVIKVLQNMVDWMEAANYIVATPERRHALFYAIASIKTDLRYNLLYEETSGQADKPTTKNNLVVDCISREQALRKLKESAEHHANDSREEVLLRRDRDIIRALPPATPQEPRWISVSEKLPNDRDWYLGIFKEPDTGWINPLPFICDYVGRETKATTKEFWILRGFTDRDYKECDYYFNLECVAWMPLPKPFELQESEDKE